MVWVGSDRIAELGQLLAKFHHRLVIAHLPLIVNVGEGGRGRIIVAIRTVRIMAAGGALLCNVFWLARSFENGVCNGWGIVLVLGSWAFARGTAWECLKRVQGIWLVTLRT